MEKQLHNDEFDFYRPVNLLRHFAREGTTKVCHDSLSLKKRLAITLYYLKDQDSMKLTANSFGIARYLTGRVVEETYTLISKNNGPSFIVFLSEKNDVFNATGCFLQKFGFLQIIACADGTHIPIKLPSQNAHDDFSCKLYYTLNCQAICDACGKLTNVEISWEAYTILVFVFVCVSVCVYLCVCVCVCVCVRHREGFICLDQLECQGTN